MDGLKKRLNRSVRARLSLTLVVAISCTALLAGLVSFWLDYRDAQELQDIVLQQVAELIDAQELTPVLLPPDPYFNDHDDATRLIVQRLGAANPNGRHVDEGGALPVPETVVDGLHTLELDGESFRVLVRTTSNGARFLVAQESDFRDRTAFASALQTTLPVLLLVPLLLLVVVRMVTRMFRPITELAQEIDRRGDDDLRPIGHPNTPLEVQPFVLAINHLLARVSGAMRAQRQFVADAAHELRSPLAALSLQGERLAQAPMSSLAHERLASLRQGIERGRNLLGQLLTLAQAQATTGTPATSVSVQAVFRRVLADVVPLAEDKGIDVGIVGIVGTEDARVPVHEAELVAIVKNLADNAVRYTPAGGRVDLLVIPGPHSVQVCVQDTGPSIPLAERGRVFDRFYRVLGTEQGGSGLGLSIVRTLADRVGARVDLSYTDDARCTGLRVIVTFPVVASITPPATHPPRSA